MWEKRAARPRELVVGLLPDCVTLAIEGAAGLGVGAKGVSHGDAWASLALLLFLIAFVCLLPPVGAQHQLVRLMIASRRVWSTRSLRRACASGST
jgi:uncharacterized membrane protein